MVVQGLGPVVLAPPALPSCHYLLTPVTGCFLISVAPEVLGFPHCRRLSCALGVGRAWGAGGPVQPPFCSDSLCPPCLLCGFIWKVRGLVGVC
jgi:hypothetical protein